MSLALAVILWICGFSLVGLELLVRNGHPELISGYDPETAADPEEYWSGWFAHAFVAVTTLVALRMVVGANRYD